MDVYAVLDTYSQSHAPPATVDSFHPRRWFGASDADPRNVCGRAMTALCRAKLHARGRGLASGQCNVVEPSGAITCPEPLAPDGQKKLVTVS